MVRPVLRRIVGALDARPDLEGSALLAALLGWQSGWLWHQLVWPGEVGQLVLGAAGVALGLTVGSLGGLAAQHHSWVGRLQVLALPGLVVGLVTAYTALSLVVADLVAPVPPPGIPASNALAPGWPVINWVVALLLAVSWIAALIRLARLARSPAGAEPAVARLSVEQRVVMVALAWLAHHIRQHPQGLLAQAVDQRPDATRPGSQPAADDQPDRGRRRWWVGALSLLIGWPRPPRPGRR